MMRREWADPYRPLESSYRRARAFCLGRESLVVLEGVDVAEQIEVSTLFTLGAHDPGGHRTVIVARMDDGA